AVVGIDRRRRVRQADAVFHGQPRARTHLSLEPVGNGHLEPRRHELDAAWIDDQLLAYGGVEGHASRTGRLGGRQRESFRGWETANLQRQHSEINAQKLRSLKSEV